MNEDFQSKMELASTPNPEKQRIEYFYKNGRHQGLGKVLQDRVDEVNALFDSEIFSKVTLPNGRVLSTSEEVHQYLFEAFAGTERESTQQAADEFWAPFQPEYISLLDSLAAQTAGAIQGADIVISISARNELQIDEAIRQFLESNHDFAQQKNIVFVVNDNFQDRDVASGVREKVSEKLTHLKRDDVKVLVLSVKLPEFSNAGMAKKIGMETILRAMWMNKEYCPIQSLDADTMGYAKEGYLNNAFDALNSGVTLAVSSDFLLDPSFLQHYPAWQLRNKLHEITKAEFDLYNRTYTPLIGASFLINPSTYFLLGGYKPQIAEDQELAKKMRGIFVLDRLFGYDAHDPVKKTNTVLLSASKEYDNIKKGLLPEEHWFQYKMHERSNDDVRKYDPKATEVPLLSEELNPESTAAAVESVHHYFLRVFEYSNAYAPEKKAAYFLCKALLSVPETDSIWKDVDIVFRYDRQTYDVRNQPLFDRVRFMATELKDKASPIESIKAVPPEKGTAEERSVEEHSVKKRSGIAALWEKIKEYFT